MKTQHTPGPWKASWNGHWQIQTRAGWLVAKVWPPKHAPHFEPSNVEANAHLIAAAPDLLEACQEMLRWMQNCALDTFTTLPNAVQECGKAKVAIAKATGGE